MTRQWTHRVVKRARGMQGEWFDFPTAATFSSFSEADAYARTFHAEQRGVGGADIQVRARSGGYPGHRGATVASYRTDRDY